MIDQRGRLEEEPFSYQQTKDQKIHISWKGKVVMILKDQKALDLSRKLEKASDSEVQLLLAKVTGNFKRGNER